MDGYVVMRFVVEDSVGFCVGAAVGSAGFVVDGSVGLAVVGSAGFVVDGSVGLAVGASVGFADGALVGPAVVDSAGFSVVVPVFSVVACGTTPVLT